MRKALSARPYSQIRAQMFNEPLGEKGAGSTASFTGYKLYSGLPLFKPYYYSDVGYSVGSRGRRAWSADFNPLKCLFLLPPPSFLLPPSSSLLPPPSYLLPPPCNNRHISPVTLDVASVHLVDDPAARPSSAPTTTS